MSNLCITNFITKPDDCHHLAEKSRLQSSAVCFILDAKLLNQMNAQVGKNVKVLL